MTMVAAVVIARSRRRRGNPERPTVLLAAPDWHDLYEDIV